jgi:Zn-dependent protease
MDIVSLIRIILSAVPVVLAITLHEAAHGYAARHFGDTTAWAAGRISLNPVRHVDPVGTLLVPGAIFALIHFGGGNPLLFGWAKPVPVNFGRLRKPLRDMIWVAAAGPAVNLLMALFWAALLKLVDLLIHTYGMTFYLGNMCMAGIYINIVLMVLNLLPLPPLDGGRIVVGLLPYRLAEPFSRLERWGFPILLLLLFTGALRLILGPFVSFFFQLIFTLFQL